MRSQEAKCSGADEIEFVFHAVEASNENEHGVIFGLARFSATPIFARNIAVRVYMRFSLQELIATGR